MRAEEAAALTSKAIETLLGQVIEQIKIACNEGKFKTTFTDESYSMQADTIAEQLQRLGYKALAIGPSTISIAW